MTSTAEEKGFLRVAVAAIPRVTEIIQGFPVDDRAGALALAESQRAPAPRPRGRAINRQYRINRDLTDPALGPQ